jgi:uncharacterized membrane-anchored protein
MRWNRVAAYLLCALALLAAPAWAQQERALFEKLRMQSGAVTLGDGIATLKVGPNFGYLDPHDAEIFLTQIWGNPKGSGTDSLGLLVPKDVDALGSNGWAVVIGFDPSGYVSDADAGKIDYDQLLKKMQQETAEASKERADEGLDSMVLLGWAKKPSYDPVTHKLYWAKRLRFGEEKGDTLNYNIRALGRRGVLVLNVVGSMDQLSMVDRRLPEILGMVSFNQGHTYAEFNPSVDQTAAYTLAGLIAGGVLAKAGFFKALFIGILALKKFLIFGAVAMFGAIGAFVKRLFRGNSSPAE